MKSKLNYLLSAVLSASFMVTVFSCKKENSIVPQPLSGSEQTGDQVVSIPSDLNSLVQFNGGRKPIQVFPSDTARIEPGQQ